MSYTKYVTILEATLEQYGFKRDRLEDTIKELKSLIDRIENLTQDLLALCWKMCDLSREKCRGCPVDKVLTVLGQ